jgi:hypothetical protein
MTRQSFDSATRSRRRASLHDAAVHRASFDSARDAGADHNQAFASAQPRRSSFDVSSRNEVGKADVTAAHHLAHCHLAPGMQAPAITDCITLGMQLLARYGSGEDPAAQAQAEVETWVVLEYCGRGELKVLLPWPFNHGCDELPHSAEVGRVRKGNVGSYRAA